MDKALNNQIQKQELAEGERKIRLVWDGLSMSEYCKIENIGRNVETKVPKDLQEVIGPIIEEFAGELDSFIGNLKGLSPEEANKYWTDFVGNLQKVGITVQEQGGILTISVKRGQIEGLKICSAFY